MVNPYIGCLPRVLWSPLTGRCRTAPLGDRMGCYCGGFGRGFTCGDGPCNGGERWSGLYPRPRSSLWVARSPHTTGGSVDPAAIASALQPSLGPHWPTRGTRQNGRQWVMTPLYDNEPSHDHAPTVSPMATEGRLLPQTGTVAPPQTGGIPARGPAFVRLNFGALQDDLPALLPRARPRPNRTKPQPPNTLPPWAQPSEAQPPLPVPLPTCTQPART